MNISDKEALTVKKKKKWIKWIVLLVLALAVLGYLYLFRQTESVAYNEYPVTQGDLTTYYNFDGLVHAPRVQTISAGEGGTVRTVYVQQNEMVGKGDRIYRIDGGETVECDLDGEVTGLYVQEGDVIAAGETAAQIIDMSRLEIHLDVDEYDVAAVAPGTPVSVMILATEQTFDAQVSALDKNGTASGDLSYYTATVPAGSASGAYPGMQVSAKVLREHVEGAALVRMEAVQFDEYNRPFVLLDKGGKEPEKTPIVVGVSDGVYCQIAEGVQPGDTVLKESGMSMMELMLELDARTR